MKILEGANLALRFLLELAALAAVGYWGWTTGDGATRWLLMLGAVGAVVVVWALYVSPKARYDLARQLRFMVELVVWGAAAAALIAADHAGLGVGFLIVAVASGVLNYRWS